MSGFVAIVRPDTAPADAGLIHLLTTALAIRGPDGSCTRQFASADLGHTLLRVGERCGDVAQPLTIDGDTWIAADVRLDDSAQLARALAVPMPVSDAELVLRAFLKWGAACVDRLAGDFAFALWNNSSRMLFCARDHLGVKPLYYSRLGETLLVGSTVECLLAHPKVPRDLDELAVADFLLFGHRTDAEATTFRNVRRVPPAHTLTRTARGDLTLRRYWTLPIEEPRYQRASDLAAEFRALLDRAVADRFGSAGVSILLSGGLDSSVIAATAARQAASSARSVQSVTFVFRELVQNGDVVHARAVADYLRIPWRSCAMDTEAGWQPLTIAHAPEPVLDSPEVATRARCYADLAHHSRVVLDGEGADNALTYEWRAYVRFLGRSGRWNQLAHDAASFAWHHRRVPPVRTVLPSRRSLDEAKAAAIPVWLARLAERLDLRTRWHDVMRPATSTHPTRPLGYFSLHLPLWQAMFEADDPAYTRLPLEVRRPFVDLRVLRFLMRVPAIPWCRDKYLIRYAFRDDLPPAVRSRPKSPMKGSPFYDKIRREGLPPIYRSPELGAFADAGLVTIAEALSSPTAAEAVVRLAAFSEWLQQINSPR